jgi:hypothetical protein
VIFYGVPFVSWDRPFDRPVPLPGERPARTLRDAGNYISKLSESERDTPEWRLAIQMLIDAAEDQGPVLFAKMGVERALNRKVERVFNPDCKEQHWGRRKAGAGSMTVNREYRRRTPPPHRR